MKSHLTKIIIKSDDKMVVSRNTNSRSDDLSSDEKGIDVIVQFRDGSKYVASFFKYEKLIPEVQRPKARYDQDNLRYFWRKNMIIINDFRIDNIERVIQEMIEEGDFIQAFEKLN